LVSSSGLGSAKSWVFCPILNQVILNSLVTHFFLDLFNPPAQRSVIKRIAELTTPTGSWINVDFLPARTLRGGILMWLAVSVASHDAPKATW
jgi:hypothetical protein